MNCEVVAVGTELLLGQIVDTNSSWIGEQLALAGINSHFQTKVGDNQARIVAALRLALERSDAVIVCGGLGPTQDDITREAIAEVMGVPLERDDEVLDRILAMFGARGRNMARSNERQADVPVGASVMPVQPGTAPGLVCPVGDQVIYAVPGVPYEMEQMVRSCVVPDLQARAGESAVIASKVLRTWGMAESSLAEALQPRLDALDGAGGNPTIAFLASGIEGIKVRITARAPSAVEAEALLTAEEHEVRSLLGSIVFGVDDETMEHAVVTLMADRGLTLGVAESLTGGLIGSRLSEPPGASKVYRGAVAAYASEVKFEVLGVREGPVVTAECAEAMADGARRVLGADVGISATGVAGPDPQEGVKPGTVFLGVALPGAEPESTMIRLPGDRTRVRQYTAISLLALLRSRLLGGD